MSFLFILPMQEVGRLFCCQGTYRNSEHLLRFRYAASAIGAKLSFAFTLVTNNGVIRQFSTSLFHASRSCFAPIKNSLALNELLVEALGTAPKSCTSFNPYQRTVLYLYHNEIKLSRTYSRNFWFNFSLSTR